LATFYQTQQKMQHRSILFGNRITTPLGVDSVGTVENLFGKRNTTKLGTQRCGQFVWQLPINIGYCPQVKNSLTKF
jgi:hypothetical protein